MAGRVLRRSQGLQRASGEYLQNLDSDDLLLPDKIKNQVTYLEAHPDVAFVDGPTRPWVRDVNVWGVLARACTLDPLLVLRVTKGRLRCLFNLRPRLSCWSF